MAGRMGGRQVTTLNLEIVQADSDRELILVGGRSRAERRHGRPPRRGQGHEREERLIERGGFPARPPSIRRRERPEPERRTVDRRARRRDRHRPGGPGPRDLRHRPPHRRAPPGGDGPTGVGPGRYPGPPRAPRVRGGGARPFRQKGTGRARQGSTRRPSGWVAASPSDPSPAPTVSARPRR